MKQDSPPSSTAAQEHSASPHRRFYFIAQGMCRIPRDATSTRGMHRGFAARRTSEGIGGHGRARRGGQTPPEGTSRRASPARGHVAAGRVRAPATDTHGSARAFTAVRCGWFGATRPERGLHSPRRRASAVGQVQLAVGTHLQTAATHASMQRILSTLLEIPAKNVTQ